MSCSTASRLRCDRTLADFLRSSPRMTKLCGPLFSRYSYFWKVSELTAETKPKNEGTKRQVKSPSVLRESRVVMHAPKQRKRTSLPCVSLSRSLQLFLVFDI